MRTRVSWGLDIGNSALKLARVEDLGGRFAVQTFGPVALPADPAEAPPDALSQGINTLLSSAGAKRATLSATLPRSLATLKFPRLPRAAAPQLAQMVRFEAQRYVPFPLEDVILSFQELPQHSHTEVTSQGTVDQVETLLVAVRRDVVAEFRAAMMATGNPPAHLTVSTLGLWNALHNAPIATEPNEAVVILDIGGRSSNVLAFDGGEMVFNRSVGMGSDHLTGALMAGGMDRTAAEMSKRERGLEPALARLSEGPLVAAPTHDEEWAREFSSEVRRSMAALRSERRGLLAERLYLSGGGAKTPGLADYLETSTGLPTQVLALPGLGSDPQFHEAVGLALVGLERGISTIDLVPEEIGRERRERRQKLQMQLATLVGGIVFVAAIFFGITTYQAQRADAQRLQQAQLLTTAADSKLKTVQKAYDNLSAQATMLKTALQPQHPWLDVLLDVSDRAPSGVWLSEVDLEKGKALALRGTALRQADVYGFSDNLSRSPLLIHPTLGYSNQAKVSEKQVFQFGINGDIAGNEPKPVKPPKKKAAKPATTPAEPGATSG